MSATTKILTLPSSLSPFSLTNSSNLINPPPNPTLFNLKPLKFTTFPLKISNCLKNPSPKINSFPHLNLNPDGNLEIPLISLRLRRLVSEFQSLPEPIDRVKRLLDYAMVLPQLAESARSPENRVAGCAAQVWLEVEMDQFGRMRFMADSDSEITKGFCSCLIFLLDGACPEDVLKVKSEDVADMNVGLPVRSRVNSWHNVLVSMQERTKSSISEHDQEICQNDLLRNFSI